MKNYLFDLDQWGEISDSLMRNKTRSFLTAFGIFWGIFMLLFLMGGGKGFEGLLMNNFKGFATNAAFMFTRPTSKAYQGFTRSRWWDLTTEDVDRVRHAVPELEVVTPVISRWGKNATYDTKSSSVGLHGEYPEYQAVEIPELKYGRPLNAVDVAEARKVCVIGTRVYEELFSAEGDPCGKTIQVDGISFIIVGVSGKEGGGMHIGGNSDSRVTIPFSTIRQMYNLGNSVGLICVTAKPGYTMTELQKKIEKVVKRAHLIHPDDKQALQLVNTEAMFSMVDELFSGIGILVWMIGVGTLLGGIIGVSNIMVVTVKERTTEIGIRRAIGATPTDILVMIMTESVALTLLAGVMGICISVGLLAALQSSLVQPGNIAQFQISFGTAVVSALVLSALGVVAGLAPALRAMRIKPVDAMREE